jgi:DNA-directed RNA polymerase specialized sigma24 family protein
VTALALKNPFMTLLAEVSRLRAFALMMTNDEDSAHRSVLNTAKRALSPQSELRISAHPRTSLFASLRNCLLRSHGGHNVRDRPHLSAFSGAWMESALMHLSFLNREAVVLTVSMAFDDEEAGIICGCAPELVRHRRSIGLTTLAELFEATRVTRH